MEGSPFSAGFKEDGALLRLQNSPGLGVKLRSAKRTDEASSIKEG
jgi:hypothetical protein